MSKQVTVKSAFKGIVKGTIIGKSDMKLLSPKTYIRVLCEDGDELTIHKSAIIK